MLFPISKACWLTSFTTTFSIDFISFATLMLLAPIPASESKKIFGPLTFLRNAEYAIIEKSLLTLAFGLKNAGSFGGTFSDNDSFGTSNLVVPSIISASSYSKDFLGQK